MKIATWNVNSIKARTEHVKRWLERVQPDVLMLQELKGLEFPHHEFDGYQIQAVGQKAYNGVAILSKIPFTVIAEKLPGDDTDEQSRYLEIETADTRIINIYLPNGNPSPGEKFDYKLRWMERLYQRLAQLRREEIPFLIGGDFNVIPEDRDCWDPAVWANDALFRIETRAQFRSLLNLGLTDAFRALNQESHQYTFWDYQAGSWQTGKGIRIDHFLLSPPVTDRLLSCTIDIAPRGEFSLRPHPRNFDNKMKTKILMAGLVVLTLGACAPTLYSSTPAYMKSKKLADPTIVSFPHCQNYGCVVVKNVELSKNDWKKINKAFGKKAKNAQSEREKIAKTIGVFEQIVGPITKTQDDKAGTFGQTGEGQLDCVDESTNTMIYMMLLDQKGLIKFHTIEQPQVRYPIVSGRGWMHQTAVVRETKTGREYAIDSWFDDNGADARIVPIPDWMNGWHPGVSITPQESAKKQK